MRIAAPGQTIIKLSESLHDGDLHKIGLQPKLCPAGNWTVGWGHCLFIDGKPLKAIDFPKIAKFFPAYANMTIGQAGVLFDNDCFNVETIINRRLKVKLNQNQFDALGSYTFNCGVSATMFKLINNSSPIEAIKEWWENHYIMSEGVVLQGLINRRKKEFALYIS